MEDLYEWKTALENALAQAPSGPTPLQNTLAQAPNASLLTGESGIFRVDASDGIEGLEQCVFLLITFWFPINQIDKLFDS